MIYTDCNDCCFCLKGQGCTNKQLCYKKPNGVINTPGYCRSFRSRQWAAETELTDLIELHKKAINEAEFKMDLLILFHESVAIENHLQRTIDEVWFGPHVNKIIIADTTGPQSHKNIALEYFKGLGDTKTYNDIPVLLDIAIEEESPEEAPKTIYRLASKIQSPFFMVMFAGRQLCGIKVLVDHIIRWPTRAIHWFFPKMVGGTLLTTVHSNSGLYITAPYKKLAKNDGKSFSQQLEEGEGTEPIKIALSWFCENCWIV